MNQADGPVRDDVRRRAALADDPVDAGVGRSCWRHRPTELNSRIIASSAFLPFHGSDDGVRLEAVEDDVDVLRRERVALDVAAVARVVQQRGVEALEQAVVDHDLLAAAPLLGRRAEEHDLAGQLVGDRRQRDRRADPRRGHRVVAAAVAEPGQRVVLGEDPDPRAVARRVRRERRPRTAVARLPAGCSTAKPWRASASATQAAAWCSSKAGSGFGVDPVRQVEDLVAGGLDGRGERAPSSRRTARRAGGGQRARILPVGSGATARRQA